MSRNEDKKQNRKPKVYTRPTSALLIHAFALVSIGNSRHMGKAQGKSPLSTSSLLYPAVSSRAHVDESKAHERTLLGMLALTLGIELLSLNNFQPSGQVDIWLLAHLCPLPQRPLRRRRLSNRLTIDQAPHVGPPGHQKIALGPLRRLDSRVLIKDLAEVGLHRPVTAGDIEVESRDDRALRHVLDHVALLVAVGNVGVVGVVGVVVEPSLRGGECVVGLLVSAEEIEGVGDLVEEYCEVAVDAVEHGDVAVRIVGPSVVGCGVEC